VQQVGYLQRLYRDAQSNEHKKLKIECVCVLVYISLVKILRISVTLLYVVLRNVLRKPVEISDKIKCNINNENNWFFII